MALQIDKGQSRQHPKKGISNYEAWLQEQPFTQKRLIRLLLPIENRLGFPEVDSMMVTKPKDTSYMHEIQEETSIELVRVAINGNRKRIT